MYESYDRIDLCFQKRLTTKQLYPVLQAFVLYATNKDLLDVFTAQELYVSVEDFVDGVQCRSRGKDPFVWVSKNEVLELNEKAMCKAFSRTMHERSASHEANLNRDCSRSETVHPGEGNSTLTPEDMFEPRPNR